MKFKTTAIAMAVAGTVAAPVAVQAGADEIYASARVGVWNVDTGGETQTDVRSFSSRFGAKGETDLGNGLTGFGRYEWDVDFNNDLGEDDISVRHRYVGLKGDFGSVLLGQTYHTFYNFGLGKLDIPWWHSGYAMVAYRGRTDNALTYAGGTGTVNFGASLYMTPDAEEEDIDQMEIGADFAIGDMTLGASLLTTEAEDINGSDEDVVSVVLSGIGLGDVATLGVGFQSQKDIADGIVAHLDIGNIYVHIESLAVDEDAGDNDPLAITLGYTQSLGRKTTMYYELFEGDADTGDSDDDISTVMAVLKYDII